MSSAVHELTSSAGWRDVMSGTAGERVTALVRHTPLVPIPALTERAGAAEAHVKPEGLQRTGSFKLRGAAAKLASLSPEQAEGGVLTASAGNHGMGVARAAAVLGFRATVVVPEITPAVKRDGIAALGAEVVVAGAGFEEAEKHSHTLAEERGAVFLPAFDDEHVIAGNGGTLGRELDADLPGGAGPQDLVLVPVGGGGLSSGLGSALLETGATIVGVEPEANCSMHDSLADGRARAAYPEGGPTIAEGLEGPIAERTFRICREVLDHVALVSEDGIRRAMAFAYRELGLLAEPSSAVALAAALDGAVDVEGRRVVWIHTGANVDPDLLDEVL